MGKEEAPLGIVGISVSFTVLVVHSVVAGPGQDGVLHRHRVDGHQEDTNNPKVKLMEQQSRLLRRRQDIVQRHNDIRLTQLSTAGRNRTKNILKEEVSSSEEEEEVDAE